MKKISVGHSIQILANFGVLVGILLLVYELNQNRDLTRAQTRAAIADGITEFLVNVASDPQLSSIFTRGAAGAELNETEEGQYSLLLTGFFRYLEDVHYQYRSGLYDEIEFQAQREQWARLFSAPGYRSYWCAPDRLTVFSPDFTNAIDALVLCSGGAD